MIQKMMMMMMMHQGMRLFVMEVYLLTRKNQPREWKIPILILQRPLSTTKKAVGLASPVHSCLFIFGSTAEHCTSVQL